MAPAGQNQWSSRKATAHGHQEAPIPPQRGYTSSSESSPLLSANQKQRKRLTYTNLGDNPPSGPAGKMQGGYLGIGTFFLVAPQPLAAGAGSIPAAPSAFGNWGGPTAPSSPKYQENCPKSSNSTQRQRKSSSAPRLRCVHQLFLEIQASTCHLREPTTFRGLIKSPAQPGKFEHAEIH